MKLNLIKPNTIIPLVYLLPNKILFEDLKLSAELYSSNAKIGDLFLCKALHR